MKMPKVVLTLLRDATPILNHATSPPKQHPRSLLIGISYKYKTMDALVDARFPLIPVISRSLAAMCHPRSSPPKKWACTSRGMPRLTISVRACSAVRYFLATSKTGLPSSEAQHATNHICS